MSEPLPPPGSLRSPVADEVHVWVADLDTLGAATAACSPEERRRALRLPAPARGDRRLRARGLLRRLLSAYTGGDPRDLALAPGPTGKPRLVGSRLEVSVTHSGPVAAVAVATRGVGVDAEHPDAVADLDALVRAAFAPAERRLVSALPADERARAVAVAWTRKEAVLKATGTGWTVPLAAVPQTAGPADGPLVVTTGTGPVTVVDLGLPGPVVAALGLLGVESPRPRVLTVGPC